MTTPAGALQNDPARRAELVRIFRAAVERVDPYLAVLAALRRADGRVGFDGTTLPADAVERFVVLAFGKASIPMAKAVVERLEGYPVEGVAVSNVAGRLDGIDVLMASHPVPDGSSVRAGRRVLELARGAGPRDVAVVAVSGGGSSLLTLPVDGVDLEDLAATTGRLLRSGATIAELNTVRKHLSQIKGGRLGEALGRCGCVLTMVLSDVVGSDLEVIASGPTVPDHSTFGDALSVLGRHGIAPPASVQTYLQRGAEGLHPETPDLGHRNQSIIVVGDGAAAAHGAAERANARGWTTRVVDTAVEGEASEVASRVVDDARWLGPGEMLVYAGETTVTVTGNGVGGRNQELALAAGIELAGDGGLFLLAAGTDGIDGVSEAAGGFADGESVTRGKALGLDAATFLQRNDSHTYLSAVGDVFVTGPTGTNVGDLILVARSG